ncbi:hypothetical protein SLA2020_431080 [Shorea laevis]
MAMESPVPPSNVVIAFDATRDYSQDELNLAIEGVKMAGGILRGGDTILMLGVLYKVLHPLGYQLRACPESLTGTSIRAMEEEVSKKVDLYVNMLQKSAEKCDDQGVSIEVQITAGFPIKQVIVQEVAACKASWVILERHLRRDVRFYLKQISCKIASILDSFSVDVLRPHSTIDTDDIEHKLFYSLSKPVLLSNGQGSENMEQSIMSCGSYPFSYSSQENSIMFKSNLMPSSSYRSQEHKSSLDFRPSYKQKNQFMEKEMSLLIFLEQLPCYNKEYVSEFQIQLATNDFSKENLLGEGGYGHVYKGKLKDGQLIAAKENQNILVYEYICNKSLDWHLFDKQASVLEWHQRFAIAIGIAKGLRFLHEECRGGPIIHRDLRPSNILLTHEFVPMLADFGLAKWKTSDDPVYTRILGTLGYLAPEYAEDGIVSVRTDVYSFGIVLLQLISGRKAFQVDKEEQQQPLRQWAEPLIQRLALHELIDRRLEESYDTYELYIMAKTAYLCVQRSAEMRPSMGEVVRLLDVGNDHFQHLREQFVPQSQYTK